MSQVSIPMTECDSCGKLKSAGERQWKERWYGPTAVRMDFCPTCVKSGKDIRLSTGNPYDSEKDALRVIQTLRSDREKTRSRQT